MRFPIRGLISLSRPDSEKEIPILSMSSVWAYLVLAVLLTPLGLPALVIGFVITSWLMMLGAQAYDFVKPVPMDRITRPEEHLKHLEETV